MSDLLSLSPILVERATYDPLLTHKSVLFSVVIAASTITAIAPHTVTFTRAASAAAELFALIDRESEINPLDESGDKPQDTYGVINIDNITFNYPSRPNVCVLKDFSLHVPAGKVTALVVSFLSPLLIQTGSVLTHTAKQGR